MRKSLARQAELGPVFDITLDCEDGAPVGGEAAHAHMAAELAMSAENHFDRVGARVHPVDHPSFADDVATLVGRAGTRLAYLMVPKPHGLADVERACAEIDRQSRAHGLHRVVPVHVLIETHGALREVQAIAAHPRIESLSFGLMDFVSAHRGAIPATAMGLEGPPLSKNQPGVWPVAAAWRFVPVPFSRRRIVLLQTARPRRGRAKQRVLCQ